MKTIKLLACLTVIFLNGCNQSNEIVEEHKYKEVRSQVKAGTKKWLEKAEKAEKAEKEEH